MSDEKTAAGLDKRVPQDSEGARLDRALRSGWSGEISPLPSFCRDVELMARIHDLLRHL